MSGGGTVRSGAIYSTLCRRLRMIGNPSERSVLLSLVVFVIIRGFAEAEPFDLLLPIWMIATIVLQLDRCRESRFQLDFAATEGFVSEAGPGSSI